jgi:hypothetical protein
MGRGRVLTTGNVSFWTRYVMCFIRGLFIGARFECGAILYNVLLHRKSRLMYVQNVRVFAEINQALRRE